MEFIDFKETNLTLGPPPGMEDKVIPIRVYSTEKDPEFTLQHFRDSGGHYQVGMVKFSEDELKQIQQTGCVCVKIMGTGWPPLLLWPAVPSE